MQSETINIVGAILLPALTAGFWYWVRSLDNRILTQAKTDEFIKQNYQRRDDALRESERIYAALKEIKEQLTKIDEKLDKKVDK